MPQYFNQTKYRSFQRQLYIYGFDRIKDKSSEDYGAYFHELFIRGASDLCLDMQRKKIKGTGLSNEERRKKANALRANSKASPNKNSLKMQQMNTSQQAPIQTPSSQSIYDTWFELFYGSITTINTGSGHSTGMEQCKRCSCAKKCTSSSRDCNPPRQLEQPTEKSYEQQYRLSPP